MLWVRKKQVQQGYTSDNATADDSNTEASSQYALARFGRPPLSGKTLELEVGLRQGAVFQCSEAFHETLH